MLKLSAVENKRKGNASDESCDLCSWLDTQRPGVGHYARARTREMYKYLLLLFWLLVLYNYHLPPSYTKNPATRIYVGSCFSFLKRRITNWHVWLRCSLLHYQHQKTIGIHIWRLWSLSKWSGKDNMESTAFCAAQTNVCASCIWRTGIAVRHIKAFILRLPPPSLLPSFLCAFTKSENGYTYETPRSRRLHSNDNPRFPSYVVLSTKSLHFTKKPSRFPPCSFSASSLFYSKVDGPVWWLSVLASFYLHAVLTKHVCDPRMRGVVRLENEQGFCHGVSCAE